jgi:hypothetical protein
VHGFDKSYTHVNLTSHLILNFVKATIILCFDLSECTHMSQ